MARGNKKVELKRPNAVLVEGADYFHVLLSQLDNAEFEQFQLFDYFSLTEESNSIVATGSNAVLKRYLEVLANNEAFNTLRSLCVIKDAEANPKGEFESIANALNATGWGKHTAVGGIVDAGNGRRSGILLLPVSGGAGCLENALVDAPSEKITKKILDCSLDYLNCVDLPKRNNNWRAKVRVHSIIAAGASETHAPAMTLGESAKTGYWDFTKPSLSPILDFLRNMKSA